MKNFIKEFNKKYMYANITFIILAIYVFLIPIIMKMIQLILPTFGTCAYLKITGKPCPLCGGTRYIAGLGNVLKNPTYLMHPFGIILIIVLIEFISRIIILIKIKKDKITNKIIICDIIWHILIIVLFISYEIIYLIIQAN